MKKFIKTFLSFVLLCLISCTDVIDVEVPNASERLVIEASIDWQKGTSGNNQTIKLSTSTPYFDTTIVNSVIDASVKITNTNTSVENIFTNQNDGRYTTSNFVPIINNTYTLEVLYNNEVYSATETMIAVPPINRTEQSIEGGYDDELLDITFFWEDPEVEENYYFTKFIEEGEMLPSLDYWSDEFTNGNEMEDIFENNKEDDDGNPIEFMPGDVVDFSLYGVSELYYNYIQLLIDQYDNGGDPFAATPAEIKGNCINVANPDNYAFGFFRVSEFDTINYTFE